MRMWVQCLALLSVLRIQHCYKLWRRSQMWLGSCIVVAVQLASDPSLSISIRSRRCSLKRKKKKKWI